MNYIVFAVIFLHFLSLGIVTGAEISIDSEAKRAKLTVRLFAVPIFVKKLAFDAFFERLQDPSQENDKAEKNDPVATATSYPVRAAISAVKYIKFKYIGLSARIGTGDAALTAMTVGSVLVALSSLCAVTGVIPDTDVCPVYGAVCADVRFDCIISFRIADIIFAALTAVRKPRSVKSINKAGRAYENGSING